ncbi:MAG: META domain-containing protein [Salibacteraceae bacterium]
MRSFTIIPILIVFTFYGCKKTESVEEPILESTKVSDLISKTWEVVSYENGGIEKFPPASTNTKYLKFSLDSSFIGHTGCNGIYGHHIANDSGYMRFTSLQNVNAAPCPTGTGEWHDIITNHFVGVTSFKITNNRMVLDASVSDTLVQLQLVSYY